MVFSSETSILSFCLFASLAGFVRNLASLFEGLKKTDSRGNPSLRSFGRGCFRRGQGLRGTKTSERWKGVVLISGEFSKTSSQGFRGFRGSSKYWNYSFDKEVVFKSSFPCFFEKTQGKTTKKQEFSVSSEPLKSLETKPKTLEKARNCVKAIFGWNNFALHYIILTATLKLHLFLFSLHYIKNSGSKLILRYIALWLHENCYQTLKCNNLGGSFFTYSWSFFAYS